MATDNNEIIRKIQFQIVKVKKAILLRKVSAEDGKLYIRALKNALSRAP